jgi:hypothetical protein
MSIVRPIARAFAELRLLAFLLATNLLVALIGSIPYLLPALEAFGHSSLERGTAFPSIAVSISFLGILGQSAGFVGGSAAVSVLSAFALQIIVASGVAFRVWKGGRFRLSEFLEAIGRFFGRNLRLFLWSLIGLAVAVGLSAGSAAALNAAGWKTLFTSTGVEWFLEPPFTFTSLAHLAFVLILFALWRGSLDLARVKMVANDEKKTRKLAWQALKQMVRSPKVLAGYAAVSLVGVFALLVMLRLHGEIAVKGAGKAWLAIAVGELVLWVRLGFSVAGYAYLAEKERRAPATQPVPVGPPVLAS